MQKRKLSLSHRLHMWARRNSRQLVLVGCLLVAWLFAHLYWYNKLTDLEFNVQAAWAQVEAEQQRRYHIQLSFTRVVLGYAEHERGLMLELTKLRTDALGRRLDHRDQAATRAEGQGAVGESGGSAPSEGANGARATELDRLSPSELNQLFPGIMLAAEQYPNLRLTENLQQLAAAMIETETRITERVTAYNDCVNKYTTILKQFPGNMFGTLWGFEGYNFYTPRAQELEFSPVGYGPSRGSGNGSRIPGRSLAHGDEQ